MKSKLPPWLRLSLEHQAVRYFLISTLCVLLILFPLIDRNPRNIDALTNAGIYVILALGLNVVVGFAGLLNLGYAGFFAIGAYTYGILASMQFQPVWSDSWIWLEKLGMVARIYRGEGLPDLVRLQFSFWLMLPIGALIAALISVLIGVPTLRLKGDYLAIVTLAFGEIIPVIIRNTPSITNGPAGLTGVRSPTFFGINFTHNPVPFYYLVLFEVLLCIFIVSRLKNSQIGRAWRALRDDELAAGCFGINHVFFKLLAFALGASFASMAGTTLVAKLTTATPEMFRLPVSISVLVMIILGGIGSIPGSIVGAILLSLLQSVILQEMTNWMQTLGKIVGVPWLAKLQLVQAINLFYGATLVLMILYRRQGLIPETLRLSSLRPDELKVEPKPHQELKLEFRVPKIDVSQPILVIQKLCKSFGGITAVDEVDLHVYQNEILSVIGPNGSGKTTLFNLITGVIPPDRGKILFEGKDITGWPSHKVAIQGIGRTFQTLHLFSSMTVLENLLVAQHSNLHASSIECIFHTSRWKKEEKEAREWAMEVLSIFGMRLLPRADHIAASLSYANRRRLEIARVLAMRPKLILLDEPTAGMNPAETYELMEQIQSLKDLGLTIILIEHKLQVVMNVSDRVIVLDYGRKICEGLPEEVRRDENVLTAYLGRKCDVVSS